LPVHGLVHALPTHRYGKHGVIPFGVQVPVPLQTWPVTVPFMHIVGPQLVPAGTDAHIAADPWHAAIWPHLFDGSTMQRLPGLEPAFAGPHVPDAVPDCLFAAEQARQVPAHVVSQQTPSAQYSGDWHCEVTAQAAPWASFGTHAPAAQ
jgi:hypothetical protein